MVVILVVIDPSLLQPGSSFAKARRPNSWWMPRRPRPLQPPERLRHRWRCLQLRRRGKPVSNQWNGMAWVLHFLQWFYNVCSILFPYIRCFLIFTHSKVSKGLPLRGGCGFERWHPIWKRLFWFTVVLVWYPYLFRLAWGSASFDWLKLLA